MQKPMSSAHSTSLIAAILTAVLAVTSNAAETDSCQASCTADLTECRKQVDKATLTESHPLLVDSSTRTRYANAQASQLVDPKELANPQYEEVQKRRMERNQKCASENSDCVARCSPAPNPAKKSVIFKQ